MILITVNYLEIFFWFWNHSGNFFLRILMIIVARIPPTILIRYFISSSIEEKLFGLMPSMAEAVPAVAAVPRMKFKIEFIINVVFKCTTKLRHKTCHVVNSARI